MERKRGVIMGDQDTGSIKERLRYKIRNNRGS